MKIAPALRMRLTDVVGVGGDDFQMLGRDGVDQRHRFVEIAHHDDRAEIAPRRGGDLSARQSCKLNLHRAFDRAGELFVVGHQDRLRAGVVLGLGQKIGGDPVRIAGVVGDDQHLGGAGDHVDADLAEHHALGRRHIGVAGPDDLGDRRNRLGAVGERRDRLRAADAINLVDAGELRRRQHQRVELAAGRRHHHHDPRHAGDLGRHRIHQHRGRIGGGAARHVKADRVDRRPARAELDAERIGEAVVLRHLPAMKNLDAVAGEFERVERGRRAVTQRGGDLFRCHLEPGPVEIEPIEFLRVLLQRRDRRARRRRRRWRAPPLRRRRMSRVCRREKRGTFAQNRPNVCRGGSPLI